MNGDVGAVLFTLAITPRNAWIGLGVLAALFLFGVGLTPRWKKVYKANIVPYLAIALCEAAVWFPGLRPGLPDGREEVAGIDGTEIGFRIGLGLILSLLVYLTYRVFPLLVLWLGGKVLPEQVAEALEKAIRKVW